MNTRQLFLSDVLDLSYLTTNIGFLSLVFGLTFTLFMASYDGFGACLGLCRASTTIKLPTQVYQNSDLGRRGVEGSASHLGAAHRFTGQLRRRYVPLLSL